MFLAATAERLTENKLINRIEIVRVVPWLSFAAQVAAEKISVVVCCEFFLADYQPKRKELFALMRAAGYSVPDAFH